VIFLAESGRDDKKKDERRGAGTHRLVAERRESVSVSGVTDVASFDEDAVVAETESGTLTIKGSGLHVNLINLDAGQLDVSGVIDSLVYGGAGRKSRGTFLGRLLK